jgi:hypothetical protein
MIKQPGIRCTPSSSEGSYTPFGGRHGWSAQSPHTKLCRPLPTLSANAAILRAATCSLGAQLVVSKPSSTKAEIGSFPDSVVHYCKAARPANEKCPHLASTTGFGPATIIDGSTACPKGHVSTRDGFILKSSISRAFRNGELCL